MDIPNNFISSAHNVDSSYNCESEVADSQELPNVLERALNYKLERAKELGISADDIEKAEFEGLSVVSAAAKQPVTQPVDSSDGGGDTGGQQEKQRSAKNKLKRKKNKRRRARHSSAVSNGHRPDGAQSDGVNDPDQNSDTDVDVTYVSGPSAEDMADPLYRQFAHIFETFRIGDTSDADKAANGAQSATNSGAQQALASAVAAAQDLKKVPKLMENDDSDDDEDGAGGDNNDAGQPKLSKRKQRLMSRMSVAQLKQESARPDMVEMHDVTARDPLLLMTLKSARNSVPVPRHWCFKRKYLQGKRGFEKPPFLLPEFIRRTGIMEMRQALQDKEDQKNLKAKMREKVRPKMGKIDIDYKKLHDAFFKWQTKPTMTIHGDLYYEGKEFETRLKQKKPGDLSDELRTALGMPVGANSHKIPPPWLIAMQRYGPPPSYPTLRIAGLNAPIPDGCSFGYHAGGWGKPPVDHLGKPLYGDVFGVRAAEDEAGGVVPDVDRALWGELDSESDSDDSESESDEAADADEDSENQQQPIDPSGMVTPAEGAVTPSGVTSVTAGLETPDNIELRKMRIEAEMEGGETPSALYQVLPERRQDRVAGSGMMASTHTYDLSAGVSDARRAPDAAGSGGVELALDPSELELVDTDAMAQRFEQRLRETQLQKEDLSDMVAEHAAKQKNKRKRVQQQDEKKSKKYKEFKF